MWILKCSVAGGMFVGVGGRSFAIGNSTCWASLSLACFGSPVGSNRGDVRRCDDRALLLEDPLDEERFVLSCVRLFASVDATSFTASLCTVEADGDREPGWDREINGTFECVDCAFPHHVQLAVPSVCGVCVPPLEAALE